MCIRICWLQRFKISYLVLTMGCCFGHVKCSKSDHKEHRDPMLSSMKIHYLVDNTNFSPEEVREIYIDFMSKHPSGRMKVEELIEEYKKLYPKGDPTEFCNLCFNLFDRNNDGCIDYKEFIVALSATSFRNEEQWLNYVFSLYDIDSSGSITQRELLDFLRIVNDLKVAKRESFAWKAKSEQLFGEFDANADRKISFNEFMTAARRDSFLTSQLPECGIPLQLTHELSSSSSVGRKSNRSWSIRLTSKRKSTINKRVPSPQNH